MSENPYSVPSTPPPPQYQPHTSNPLSKLKPPAICLIVVTILGVFNFVIGLVLQYMNGTLNLSFDGGAEAAGRAVGTIIGMVLFPIVLGTIMYAAINMLNGKNWSGNVLNIAHF